MLQTDLIEALHIYFLRHSYYNLLANVARVRVITCTIDYAVY